MRSIGWRLWCDVRISSFVAVFAFYRCVVVIVGVTPMIRHLSFLSCPLTPHPRLRPFEFGTFEFKWACPLITEVGAFRCKYATLKAELATLRQTSLPKYPSTLCAAIAHCWCQQHQNHPYHKDASK